MSQWIASLPPTDLPAAQDLARLPRVRGRVLPIRQKGAAPPRPGVWCCAQELVVGVHTAPRDIQMWSHGVEVIGWLFFSPNEMQLRAVICGPEGLPLDDGAGGP
jgi:hypothetical protein